MKIGYRLIFAVFGFFVFLYSMEVWAGDWKFYSTATDGNSCYYDPQSIKRVSKDIVQVKEKIVCTGKSVQGMVKKLGPKFKELSYIILLLGFNCGEEKIQILSSTTFNKNGGIIDTFSYDSPPWHFIIPGPGEEILFNIVCGGDWKILGEEKDGGDRYYYDPQSIKCSSKDIVQVREKIVYSEKGVQDITKKGGPKYKEMSYSIQLWEFNCREKKFHTLSFVFYNKDGEVMDCWEYGFSWDFIVPGSVGETLFNIVCGSR